jgi:uncharacterized protein GlcG (DUF336 family)
MTSSLFRFSSLAAAAFAGVLLYSQTVFANPVDRLCQGLPAHDTLQAALREAKSAANGGFGTEMWGAVVNRNGVICAVVHTGSGPADQWPGSRLIAVAKAYTANAFSLPSLSVSTANLFFATQPGGPLSGLAQGNPLDTSTAYAGKASSFGTDHDPLVGNRVGGTITFGGGVALYNARHELVGGLGVSGDSSCADHNIAWRTRNKLELDYVPGGVSKDKAHADSIIFDISNGKSAGGWGHAACGPNVAKVAASLPTTRK